MRFITLNDRATGYSITTDFDGKREEERKFVRALKM